MKLSIRTLPGAVSLAAAGLLAGCANTVIVSEPDLSPSYSPTELAAAGSGENALRVVVAGDPFGAGKAATDAATVAAMQGNVIGIPVNFSLDPARERTPPTRVVVYFNARNMVGGESICAPNGPVAGKPTTDGSLRVTAAWCQTNFTISRVAGQSGGVTSLDSPKFRVLMARVTQSLFPPRNANLMRSGRGCTPPC